ncbi:uncharacterized protein LOC122498877 isoform X2 [Leptopilina heterotoma]|uniref:uncharacterized protein LOC122498877 isoform X2 n=1 Tax=Leptopilina heterotoma TaxID=63436 RepID=UPI001CA7EACA|nr:uncharacterized protein LOC122498877 isoform X2 [Leptopilina heterotoma]
MIRLAIICFLISMIESERCTFSIAQLNKLRQLFNDSDRRMEEATRGQSENAAIVIGNGRGGKSTLINYLMGNELVAYRSHTFDPIKIRKANENSPGPEIGAGSLSTTTIPLKWKSTRTELKNLDIWDTAGFSDNRGVEQDLNNSFHLYHLAKKVESVKFILVIDFDDIRTTSVQQILQLLKALEEYFIDNFKDIFRSISVIIAKAPKYINDDIPANCEYLNYKLTNSLLSQPEMDISEDSKNFLRHVIANNQRVAFFRKAKKLGPLTSDIDDNIIPAINNCTSISKSSNQNIGFTMSSNSKNCLQYANQDLLNMNEFEILEKQVENWFTKNYNAWNELKDKNILNANKENLRNIYARIDISSLYNSDVKDMIQILKINYDTIKIEITEELMNKIDLSEFIDSLITTGKMINEIDKAGYDEKIRLDNKKHEEESRYLQHAIRQLEKIPEEQSYWDQFLQFLLSHPVSEHSTIMH